MLSDLHQGKLVTKTDRFVMDDDIESDLEVAMINETFEEQLKQTLQYHSEDLKLLFYGEKLANMKESIQNDLERESLSIQLLSPSQQHVSLSEDEVERGRQLDIELERMMLDEDDICQNLSDSPALLPNIKNPLDVELSTMTFASYNSLFPYSKSQINNNDSEESVEAAEAIANNVIQFLFADENNPSDSILNNSNKKILDENNIASFIEEMDNDSKNKENPAMIMPSKIQTSPYDLLRVASSPMDMTDKQTIPVFDNWEELVREPIAATKICNEAAALFKKICAERKATQL